MTTDSEQKMQPKKAKMPRPVSMALATIVTALALGGPAAAADPPRAWFILNFETGKCVPAAGSAMGASPQIARTYLRRIPLPEQTTAFKDAAGAVTAVSQEITTSAGQDVTVWWYPDAALCDVGRGGFVDAGVLPDPADLK